MNPMVRVNNKAIRTLSINRKIHKYLALRFKVESDFMVSYMIELCLVGIKYMVSPL